MSRRGFTLVETLLVIVIMSLVFVMAIPRMRDASVKRNIRGGRNTLQGLYAQARVFAIQQARSTGVRFNGNSVFLTGFPRTDGAVGYDTISNVRDLNKEFGVTLTLTPTVDVISIGSHGLARMPDGVKVTINRDGYKDSLVVSQYGRIQK